MKKLVVLTGAGVSAESGLKTFREMGGLWEQYNIMEVASFKGWQNNPGLVLQFYNQRRKQLMDAEPNAGHLGLAELEKHFDVYIVTQNVDDLHERAGSTKVLHLHGELKKSRSTVDPNLIYDINGWKLNLGDKCEKGSQLRPHIVWFGEDVPAIDEAIEIVKDAEVFIIVGTSMFVYPAAGLIDYVKPGVPIYIIDPNELGASIYKNAEFIKEKASVGVPVLIEKLLN